MSDGVFKTPKAKKTMKSEENQLNSIPPKKRCRTAEDFFTFCNLILEHENYEAQKQEEQRSQTSSPLGRVEDMSENIKCENTTSSSSSSSEDRKGTDIESGTSDEDSYDLVTCYCLKPFAGRPMIECSECLTWIHLSCAKIRKSNIPDEFTCQRCKDAKMTTRRSQRKDGDRDSLSPSWVH